MIAFTIDSEAVPFARAGTNGSSRFTPKKQADFMALVSSSAWIAMRKTGIKPFDGPVAVDVEAIYIAPKSWSLRRQRAAKWKTSAPDLDNIVKLLKDAMSKIVYVDDALVVQSFARKRYGPSAKVTIIVAEIQ